ncbi:MAG: hypothetical protein ACO3GP_02665 [Candidatus Limnocylindrus sp.]
MAQEGLGEAVLVVTVRDGQATEAINKLRTALANLSSFSSKESGAASSVGRAIETATNRATASVARLAETYKRVQTEQQATIRNARTLTQELLSRGVTPLTTTPAAQREQQNAAARNAAQERRAQTAASQTAGGSGLTRFLREQDQLAETAARSQARAAIAERRAENRATQTAGGSGLLSFFRRQEQLQQELRDDAEVQLQRAAAQARRAESFEQRLTQSRQRSARATETAVAAENTRRRADLQGRISSGLIGGAFPLLFGQGPGAALGGLAGGVAGGGAFGFGASLVGTGIGASFDALIARSKELAEALRDPIASFDQLKAASVLSSRGLETYIDALIKTGQTAKAEQLIRADLTQNVNPTTAAALSQANDELARSFSDVQEKLSGLVAGPAIAFLKWLDEIIDRLPIRGPGGAAPGQLPSPAAARATAQAGREKQGIGLGLAGASLGTILAATALSATGIGAPAGAALLAYGLLGTGAAAVGAGKFQESQGAQAETDISTQRLTAALQKEIEATQQRRVILQKQLVGFTGDENSAAAQIAQGQNVVLTAQEAVLKAKEKFLSLPADASAEENATAYKELKDSIAAARIEVEKFIAANNNQARSLKRTTDVRERTAGFTSSARQGAVLADAVVKAREEYDKAKAATASATGDEAIAAAQSIENKLGQAWRSAAQDLADYNSELAFTAERQAQLNKLAADKVAQDLKAVQVQRQLAQNAQRTAQFAVQQSTLSQIDSIEAAVNDARRRESDLGDQITTARQRGDETLAASLVAQQKTAAQQTRLELEKGAEALAKTGIKLREDVNAAFLNLQKLRTGPEGLNAYLGAGDRARREQEVFKNLLPGFRQDQQRFKELTGARFAPEFRGSTESVNADIIKFRETVRAEEAALDATVDIQKALNTNTSKLAEVNADLATKVAELNQKDWTVQLTQDSSGRWSVSGDARSQAELRAASTLP